MKTLTNDTDWLLEEIQKLTWERPTMEVSEWAEAKRVLPSSLTSQPGPWRNSVAPYLVEIMNCFSERSLVQKVAVMKGTQIGCTTGVIENPLGYIIDHSPGPVLYVGADKAMAEQSIELKIDRMLQSSGLTSKIFSQSDNLHNKKTGDTKTKKEFPGGFLLAVGPNSGSKLRSFSIRFLFFDELDAYPVSVGSEGDPIKLAEKRTDAFEAIRKIAYISTPIEELTSKIYPKYQRGDQRKYFIPCIHCGHKQELIFEQLKYELSKENHLIPNSVGYECVECKKKMNNSDKVVFLGMGEWRPTKKAEEPNYRSYHISALYSPIGMKTWENIIYEWLESKDDEEKLRAFVNTVKGEPYVEKGQSASYDKVINLRDTYDRGTIVDAVLLLTAGVDIQKDRIEIEVVGWGKDAVSWSIDYKVFFAQSEKGVENSDDPCWTELAEYLTKDFPAIGGHFFNIQAVFIDSSYLPGIVYAFCETFSSGVYPVQGRSREGLQIGSPIKASKVSGYEIIRYDISPNYFKDLISSYLIKEKETAKKSIPKGYCHFPKDYPESYFKQLTAEDKFLKKDTRGNKYYVWRNTRNIRNEALDCRVYAFSAVYQIKFAVETSLKKDKNDPGISWTEFWERL